MLVIATMNRHGYSDIHKLILALRGRYRFMAVAEAAAAAFSSALVCLILSGLLETFLYLQPAVKFPLFLFTAGIFPAVFAALLIIRLVVRHPDELALARMIEKASPSFRDRLISAVQLGGLEEHNLQGQSSELVDALVSSVAEECRTVDIRRVMPFATLAFPLRAVYSSLLVLLLVVILSPLNIVAGLYRLSHYDSVFPAPNRTTFHLIGLDDMIIRGGDFTIRGIVAGRNSDDLKIVYRQDGMSTWTVRPVKVSSKDGFFSALIEKPSRNFRVYLEAGGNRIPEHAVTVVERPDIESIESVYHYPAYTGLGDKKGENGSGYFRVLEGTVIDLTVTAGKPLRSMQAIWSDSTVTDFAVERTVGKASFTVKESRDFHFDLVDTQDIGNINPISYRVTALTDEPPRLEVLLPPPDANLPMTLIFPLAYRASDDYGLSLVELSYHLPFEDSWRKTVLKKSGISSPFEGLYEWDLSDVGLLPGDSVEYMVTVYDNDTVNGPKKADSGVRKVLAPSMEDMYGDLDEQREENITTLKDISERTKQDTERLDDVRKSVIDGKKMDWSDKNAIENAKDTMSSMQKDLSELSDTLEKMADNLNEEDMATLETIEQYRKISDLMDEIADGELKEALKRLTEASVNLDPKKLKEAIEKHKVSAEDIKKKLDRMIDLLEKVQTLQRFETAQRMLEDIAAEQAELERDYQDNPDDPALRRRQEKLAAETEKLKEELKAVAEELTEKFDMKTDELKEALEEFDAEKSMEMAAQNMSSGDRNAAKMNMNMSSKKLAGMMGEMSSFKSAMSQKNSEELKKRLFTALTDLIALSDKQEKFVYSLPASDPRFEIESSRQALELMDVFATTKRSMESLGELAVELSSVCYGMTSLIETSMKNAVDDYATGRGAQGAKNADTALRDMNKTVFILTEMMSGGSGGSGGMPGDLMQMLGQMAGNQLSLQSADDAGRHEQ